MPKLPKKITPSPLMDAIIEIRFASNIPTEAVFGVVFQKLQASFKGSIHQLPILNIPPQIREGDNDLKYGAHYRIDSGRYSLAIGPRAVIFSVVKDYDQWNTYRADALNVLRQIKETGIISRVERLGVRYTNIFETKNVFDVLNLKLLLGSDKFSFANLTLAYEQVNGDVVTKVQISNAADIHRMGQAMKRRVSLLDIDVITMKFPRDDFFERIETYLDHSHEKLKETFFQMLSREYVERELSPTYE